MTVLLSKFALLAFSLTQCVAQDSQWLDEYRLEYGYDLDGQRGPNNWRQVDISQSEWVHYRDDHPIHGVNVNNNLCGIELRPSPVNLFQTFSCNDNHEMITPQITDTTCQQDNISYELTPASLRAYFPFDDAVCDKPSVRLSGTPNPFVLQWVEVHLRSEHVIDGRRFDAELQMVHMGTGRTAGQLTIVALLIESNAREDNAEFQVMLDQWQLKASEEETECSVSGNARRRQSEREQLRKRVLNDVTSVAAVGAEDESNNETAFEARELQNQTPFQSPCDPDRFGNGCEPLGPRRKMFPYNLWPTIWYYSYRGSITAPPCASIVQWRVLDVPLQISRRQYKQLAQLLKQSRNSQCESDSQTSTAGENARPLQTLDDDTRRVAHCTIQSFSYWAYPEGEQ